MRKVVLILLFAINFVFSQASITWTNAPTELTFYPGQEIQMNLNYSTDDIDYICVWIRELDSMGNNSGNEYGAFVTCPLSGGNESHPNSDSINYKYVIPSDVPDSSSLPSGHKYSLVIFLSSDVGGFANDSRDISISSTASTNSQISVSLNAKHIVGGIETFDRSKFITIHSNQTENEWSGNNFVSDLRNDFLNGYNVYLGRDTGGITWNLNQIQQDPSRPGFANPSEIASRGLAFRNNYTSQTSLHEYESRNNLIIAGQLHPFWTGDGQQSTNQGWNLASATATGEYMGRFINEFHGVNGQPKPTWVEIINEPAYESLGGPSNYTNNIQEIADFHNEVSLAIKAQAPNTLVGGYTAAFPNFEVGDFQRWNNRWKLFMDETESNMDFWSIHLYDFPSIGGGQKRLRSGSNLEATFDMIEQYSQMTFGNIKPIVISEYGAQMHDYLQDQWTPYRDWLHIAASNKMLMSFMQRPQHIASAINFTIVKAEWGYNNGIPYSHRLMRKENEPTSYTGPWVYTDVVKFYQLWSNVNGTRVDSISDNHDLQVDAYVDGEKAYIIVNNLNFISENFDLSLFGYNGANISSLNSKKLYLDGENPVLIEESLPIETSTLSIEPEATTILEYTFDSSIMIDEIKNETKYYSDIYLQSIIANNTTNFTIDNVSLSNFGEAILRVGIGRTHALSLQPIVVINNNPIALPNNFRGDSQIQRDSFFGVLEIPIDFDILQETNTISITFPDDGGHVSTVTMQVFNFSNDLRNTLTVEGFSDEKNKVKVFPNPTNGIINFSKPIHYKEASIYNNKGSLMKTFKNNETINIIDFPNGLYFLKTDNEVIYKIIK
jgi:agarase